MKLVPLGAPLGVSANNDKQSSGLAAFDPFFRRCLRMAKRSAAQTEIQDGFPRLSTFRWIHPASILHGGAQVAENTWSGKSKIKIGCIHAVSILDSDPGAVAERFRYHYAFRYHLSAYSTASSAERRNQA